MNVQFDLRTPEYIEYERKVHSFNILRVIAILLVMAFIVTSSGYIAKAVWKLRSLKSEIETKESEFHEVEASRLTMAREIENLRSQEQDYRKSLQIMQDEPATLEALNVLEMNMESGVALTEVCFVPVASDRESSAGDSATVLYAVTVEGSAVSEGQITSLMEGLRTSGVFSSVVMPNSQRGNNGRVNFNLVLNLLPFGQISQL